MFFDPSSFSYPAGFPKGNTAYTTPKVIVAKAFSPASNHWKYANTPFDPVNSDHATNVAGIAAGDHDTVASIPGSRPKVSGIAPIAYLGNYKVLTVPTADFGLDGNSPEIAKGIEEAVKDGMDVINLSLGEPEIEPSRDIVVAAIDNAANAGVVPVVAAGNEFEDEGRGSIGSPGTAPDAITVAASSEGDNGPADVIAGFSSSGPTPTSLQMKPDVTAPGVDILSSLPGNTWSDHDWSGTSMASPHVAGAAAILKERHPAWTVEQIKSALESTGDPVHPSGAAGEVSAMREGGGRIDLPRADNPLIFTDPAGISFALVKPGTTATKQISTADAGGGPAPWTATILAQSAPHGANLSLSAPTVVAGSSLTVTLNVAADAVEGDAVGFVELTRGTDVRRIPYWLHVEIPKLGTEPHVTISRPGVYGGTTAGKRSIVSSYRYPDGRRVHRTHRARADLPHRRQRDGREPRRRCTDAREGRQRLTAPGGRRRREPPHRLHGAPHQCQPVSAIRDPRAGRRRDRCPCRAPTTSSSTRLTGGKPGKFTFRVWINDTTPPKRPPAHAIGAARNADSGRRSPTTAPASTRVRSRSRSTASHPRYSFEQSVLRIPTSRLSRGTHRVKVAVSDYEEAKNMENVGPILPNTRSFSATVTVR